MKLSDVKRLLHFSQAFDLLVWQLKAERVGLRRKNTVERWVIRSQYSRLIRAFNLFLLAVLVELAVGQPWPGIVNSLMARPVK